MAHIPASGLFRGASRSVSTGKKICFRFNANKKLVLLAAAIIFSPLAFAQSSPQVASVDPSSGKVNDTVTLAGENLGKGSVAGVFLSDDSSDFKATIVDQSAEKIVLKIPQVKSGNYNISIQVGDKIFIKPVKFKVES